MNRLFLIVWVLLSFSTSNADVNIVSLQWVAPDADEEVLDDFSIQPSQTNVSEGLLTVVNERDGHIYKFPREVTQETGYTLAELQRLIFDYSKDVNHKIAIKVKGLYEAGGKTEVTTVKAMEVTSR